MLKILLADDHDIVRRGIKELLEVQQGWSVCAEAIDGRTAVELAVQHRPGVAILDLAMPQLNGLEAARRIRALVPETEVLLFTMHESEELVREALAAGVRGYLLKSDAAAQLIPAVRGLAQKRPFFTGRISEVLVEGFLHPGRPGDLARPANRLTTREREVVQLLAEGQSNKDIARTLELSVKTVETHRAAAMRKLKLKSLADLVRFAIKTHIVQP
jgi:DNA-binding NarL/FixJ family response regulator